MVLELLSSVLTNPRVVIVALIQFALGFALGYLMVRVAKYLLALIAIFVLGTVLNVWSLGGSVEQVLKELGLYAVKVKDVVLRFLHVLGLLVVGPLTLGFLVGLLVGVLRR
ncbi:MAG: hypothetical protein DRJ40_07210 [Thermoprotei archaeon]|nr:MAG: hypothetical protein DRJ40_07210 [Thermoprotei archaeon]